MDYKKVLAAEAGAGHVAFHEYALHVEKEALSVHFLFFEGDEDPAFYMPHITFRLGGRRARAFICYGRHEVLKAHELVSGDGRGAGRVLFFLDKDHNDIVGGVDAGGLTSVFQTQKYSIENYLVSADVLAAYWVQRLHLSCYDVRFNSALDFFEKAIRSFWKRSILISALIICGRGVDGRKPVKLNLNNIQMDKVFKFNPSAGVFRLQQGAFEYLLKSSNLANAERISGADLRRVACVYLKNTPMQTHIRGKYELWAFWRVLTYLTQEMSSKSKWADTDLKRATPNYELSHSACVESLSPLAPCPPELEVFLRQNIPAASNVTRPIAQ